MSLGQRPQRYGPIKHDYAGVGPHTHSETENDGQAANEYEVPQVRTSPYLMLPCMYAQHCTPQVAIGILCLEGI